VAAAKKTEKSAKSGEHTVAQHAPLYNYHILRNIGGWSFTAPRVKALREGKANIRDAYVDFKPTGAWLVNAHIAPVLTGALESRALSSRKSSFIQRAMDKLSGRIESRLDVIPFEDLLSQRHRQVESPGAGQEVLGPRQENAPRKLAEKSNNHVQQSEAITHHQITLAPAVCGIETEALVSYVFERNGPRSRPTRRN